MIHLKTFAISFIALLFTGTILYSAKPKVLEKTHLTRGTEQQYVHLIEFFENNDVEKVIASLEGKKIPGFGIIKDKASEPDSITKFNTGFFTIGNTKISYKEVHDLVQNHYLFDDVKKVKSLYYLTLELKRLEGWENVVEGRGISSSVIGMLIVFSGLTTLYIVLLYIHRFLKKFPQIREARRIRREKRAKVKQPSTMTVSTSKGDVTIKQTGKKPVDNQIAAAICLSVYMNQKILGEAEKQILTWKKYHKPYSPWSISGKFDYVRNLNILSKK